MKGKSIKQIKQALLKSKSSKKDGVDNSFMTREMFLQFLNALDEMLDDLEMNNKKLSESIDNLEKKNKQMTHQVNIAEDKIARLESRVKLR